MKTVTLMNISEEPSDADFKKIMHEIAIEAKEKSDKTNKELALIIEEGIKQLHKSMMNE